jgi:hypothetical protein
VTAHDFADLFDVRRAIAGKDVGDLPEVARAQQARTDDCEEAGVDVAAVTESVDHAPRYEECLARAELGVPSADGKRGDAVQPEDGFIEVVVAVWRGHTCISGDIALEDTHAAFGLVCVDVKTDGKSSDLDRFGDVRHERKPDSRRVLAEHGSVNDKEPRRDTRRVGYGAVASGATVRCPMFRCDVWGSGLDILLARPGKAWWRLEGRDPAFGLFLSIAGRKRLWWLVAALR